jgi:dienelactone hydrolase
MKRLLMSLLAVLLGAGLAEGKVRTESVVYKQGNTSLDGYFAFPDGPESARHPGVIVVHDWRGLGDYAKSRAEQLAEAGFVALAVDIYGQGVRPQTPEECSKQAGIYRADRALMRARARAGFDLLRSNPRVDPDRIAAIGYCFGGAVSLELARSGAPLAGVVSFHGALDTPNPADARAIRGKVLVCHGADDPYVPPEQVAAFEKEMRDAGVDYEIDAYGGAVHSFTVPDAGNDPSKGAAYNAAADRRSWKAMLRFFGEIFG